MHNILSYMNIVKSFYWLSLHLYKESFFLRCPSLTGAAEHSSTYSPLSVSRMSKTNTTLLEQIQIKCDTACSLWPPWSKCLVWRPSLSVCAKTHSCHSHPIQLSRSESWLFMRAQPQKRGAFLLLTCFWLLKRLANHSSKLLRQVNYQNQTMTSRAES